VELNTHSEIVAEYLGNHWYWVAEWIEHAIVNGDPIRESLVTQIENWLDKVAEPEEGTSRVIPDIMETLHFEYEAIADRLIGHPRVLAFLESEEKKATERSQRLSAARNTAGSTVRFE